MKLAIVGYGKMGKLIEQLAPEFGFEVVLKLDIDQQEGRSQEPGVGRKHSEPEGRFSKTSGALLNNLGGVGITRENFRSIDVAIEFSTPATAVENIEHAAAAGINLVVGTTGWLEQLERVKQAVGRAGIGLVYSPNFSVGMQVFSRMVEAAAQLFKDEADYDAWGYEIHHKMKKDAPSGTLLKLQQKMQRAGYKRPIDMAANRAGAIPGTHVIGFDSEADTITLTHTARSRAGFARGALRAAQWVVGKKGVYEFSEVLFGNLAASTDPRP